MAYPTQGGPQSVFKTKTIESSGLGEFLNGLTKQFGTNWDVVNISPANDSFISYVTYRVDVPQDNAPALPEDPAPAW